jgi:mitochondrial fission protein ELM1
MTNKAWIIVDHEKIGARNQCLGLAAALDLESVLKVVDVKPIFRYLPSVLWPRSLSVLRLEVCKSFDDQDLPCAFIASGRRALILAVVLKKKYPSIPLILLQKPSIFKNIPDIILLPEHDNYKGKNVLTMIGNPHLVNADRVEVALGKFSELKILTAGMKIVTILMGGPNKAFGFPVEGITHILQNLLEELEKNVDVFYLVTLSRRTPKVIQDYVFNINHPRMYVWDNNGPNPYLAFLGLADMFVITADSVAMASEAASMGKPIHMINLPGKSKKFERFHARLKELGISRDLRFPLNEWGCKPLRETERIAKAILKKLTVQST